MSNSKNNGKTTTTPQPFLPSLPDIKANAKKIVLWSILLGLSIALGAYFFETSNFSFKIALDPSNFESTINMVLSQQFILFILALPIPFAMITAICRHFDKKTVRLISIAGFTIGFAAALIFFQKTAQLPLLYFAFLISLLVVIEAADFALLETKKFALQRAAAKSIGKGFFVMTIGLFIYSAVGALYNQDEYLNNFEEKIVTTVMGDNEIPFQEMGTKLLTESSKQTIDAITKTNEYRALAKKDDIEVKNFITLVKGMRNYLDSKEYLAEIKKDTSVSKIDLKKQIFGLARQKIPSFSLFEEYFWLVAAFVFTSFFMLGRYLAMPLAMIYATIFGKILEVTEKK